MTDKTGGSFAAPYEDTLRTLRTGKSESSPLGALKRYMAWGRSTSILPSSTMDSAASPSPGGQDSSFLTWPPWASTNTAPPPFYETFGLSIMQRYMSFALCIGGAALLIFLAMMQLPIVVFRPSKFVVPYCLASILVFVSFGFLHGFYSYARHLVSPTRWPFSAAFLGTTLAALYAAMVLRMFAMTVPLVLIQMVAMVAYVISYLPGGTSGITMMSSLVGGTLRSRVTGF